MTWHGTLDPRTIVIWRDKRMAVRDLASTLQPKWRSHLGAIPNLPPRSTARFEPPVHGGVLANARVDQV